MARSMLALTLVGAAAALDITALLGSVGPAPATDPRFTNFQPPGPNDVRSPCPGLNTLANHGFIHHDGRNMTIPHLVEGLAAGMNFGPDFSIAIGGAGLLSAPDPLAGSFDLNHLDQHNFPIEHDASQSRLDAYFGNDYSFNNKTWQMVLNYYKGKTLTDIPTASKAKYARVNDSLTRNPEVVYGAREFLLSYGEVALYLQSMSDPTSGMAKVSYVRSLFEQEKLPFALGWRPSASPITLTTLGNMIGELYAANPNNLPEGLTVTTQSYKDVFEGIVGGSEIFANLTNGLSTAVGL